MQTKVFDEFAISNDYTTSGSGKTRMQFLLDRAARRWVRLDRVEDVELLSSATYIEPARAARYCSEDRHSETRVSIELAPGDVLAVMNRGGKQAIEIREIVETEGGLKRQSARFAHMRNAAGGWDIKLRDQDGNVREILPSLRQGVAR